MIRINNTPHLFENIGNTPPPKVEKLDLNSIKTVGTMKDMSKILADTKSYLETQRAKHQRSA